MTRHRRHSPFFAAIFALMIGLFALSPVVDAVACAAEFDPSHATTSVEQPDTHKSTTDAAHGVCSHGHCHHGSKAPKEPTDSRVLSVALIHHDVAPDDMRPSHAPDGLKRPPRD